MKQTLEDKWLELSATLLALTATVLLGKFGEAVFDSATNALGKTLLLQIAALLVFSFAYLGWRVFALRKEKPEVVRLLNGIEFRRSKRTWDVWMPFCPQCHVVLHPDWERFDPVRCSAACGWHSHITPRELCDILNKNNSTAS